MENQTKSILVIDSRAEVYDQLLSEFEERAYTIFYLPLIPDIVTLANLLDSHEYAVLLVDENFANSVKGLDIARFVQNAHPDIETMYLASDLSGMEPADTYRYFKKPINYQVLALNIQLAARKNHIAKRKKRALQALHDASKKIMRSQSEDEILHTVVNLASTIMDTSRSPGHFSHLALLKHQERVLVFNEAHHSPEVWQLLQEQLDGNEIDLRFPQDGKIGIVGRVIKERKSQRQGNVKEDLDYIPLHQEVNSQLAVPIKMEERIFGVINVEHPDRNAFDENDEYALEALSALVGVAMEKVHPYEKERKQSKALKVLHDMGEMINGRILLTRDQIIRETVKQVKNFMLEKRDGYLSHFAMKEGRQLIFYEAHNLEDENRLIKTIDGHIDLDNPATGRRGIIGRAVETAETQLVGNVADDDDYIQFEPYVKSQLAVPIIINEVVFGAINIEHPDYEAFDENDKENLEILASKLAIAIHNSDLYWQQKQWAKQLELLYETGQLIARSDNLVTTLQNIAKHALFVLGNATSTVMFFSHVSLEENGFLHVVSASPSSILRLYADRIEMSIDVRDTNPRPGISGICFRTGEILNVGDVSQNVAYIPISQDIQSQLSVPLIYDGAPIGVISIESSKKHAFSETDQEIVSLLAKMAVITIKNAQLYAENKHQQEISNDLADKLMSKDEEQRRVATLIEKHFSPEELEDVAFKLGRSINEVPGNTHKKKVREFLSMCGRHGLGSELLDILRVERSFVEW